MLIRPDVLHITQPVGAGQTRTDKTNIILTDSVEETIAPPVFTFALGLEYLLYFIILFDPGGPCGPLLITRAQGRAGADRTSIVLRGENIQSESI